MNMKKGRGQEAPVQEDKIDMREETTALNMNMRKEEEEEEEVIAQKIEAAGDTLAMTDEETAQGP